MCALLRFYQIRRLQPLVPHLLFIALLSSSSYPFHVICPSPTVLTACTTYHCQLTSRLCSHPYTHLNSVRRISAGNLRERKNGARMSLVSCHVKKRGCCRADAELVRLRCSAVSEGAPMAADQKYFGETPFDHSIGFVHCPVTPGLNSSIDGDGFW